MNYNLSYVSNISKKNIEEKSKDTLFRTKELSCVSYADTTIIPMLDDCPGYAVSPNGEIIDSSLMEESCRPVYVKERFEIHDDERTVFLLFNFISNCYGHTITDGLRKLWYFLRNDYSSIKNKGITLVGLTYKRLPIPNYYYEILKMFGIDDHIELIEKPTRFKSVIIPDNSLIWDNGLRYYTREFKDTIRGIKSYVLAHTHPSLIKNVYFTRTKLRPTLREMGEYSVERLFRNKGFTIIAPEKYSILDQFRIAMDCETFVSTEGSISHTTIFCNIGTKAVILRKCNHFNTYQQTINDVAQLNAIYIDAHHSIMAKGQRIWSGPFYIYETNYIKDYLGINYLLDCHYIYPSWWWYMFRSLPFVEKTISNRHIFRKIEKILGWN